MNRTLSYGDDFQRRPDLNVHLDLMGNPPRLVERGGMLVLQTYMGCSGGYVDDGRGLEPGDAVEAWEEATEAHGDTLRTCLGGTAPPPPCEKARFWDTV